MIDFPASPTLGQQFTAAGVTWTWDGAKWLPSGLAPTVVPGINDNRIINGDMRIDQRNNGASGTAVGYLVDRWQFSGSLATKGTWGRTPSTVPGFPYCLGFTSNSAYAVPAAGYFTFAQTIEADMISDFAWGTANAQPVTLSFWAASSLTGTFGGSVQNYAGTRSYPFTYSLPSAGVWTRISITIPGDTSGAWVLSGNAGALWLNFGFGVGTTSSGPANAWASANYSSATGAVSVVGTNAATFYITGVKLEIGSVATPFNRQSLAKSQADCERYFRWIGLGVRFMATAGAFYAVPYPFAPAMRAAPTLGAIAVDPNVVSPGTLNAAQLLPDKVTPYSAMWQLTPSAVGDCYVLGYRSSASAEL